MSGSSGARVGPVRSPTSAHPAFTAAGVALPLEEPAQRPQARPAAIVVLPIDDDRLDVRPLVRDEVLYVSASPQWASRPVTIERLAGVPLVFYDAESADDDPIRRQLAERARADGVTLRPRTPGFPEGLATASFTRRAARLSPAARELIGDLEAHMQAVASDLDRTR